MIVSDETQQLLQAAANLVTSLGFIITVTGLFIALRSFRQEKENERRDRAYSTFDDLDNKYVEFMYKCAESPNLDFFSEPAPKERTVTQEELRVERAMFSVLMSIFERAFLMFERLPDEEAKDRQYSGWIECMRLYCTRESFLHEWRKIGTQFDAKFQEVMNGLISDETGIKKNVL